MKKDKNKISGKTFIADSAEEMTFNQIVAKVKVTLGGAKADKH